MHVWTEAPVLLRTPLSGDLHLMEVHSPEALATLTTALDPLYGCSTSSKSSLAEEPICAIFWSTERFQEEECVVAAITPGRGVAVCATLRDKRTDEMVSVVCGHFRDKHTGKSGVSAEASITSMLRIPFRQEPRKLVIWGGIHENQPYTTAAGYGDFVNYVSKHRGCQKHSRGLFIL